MRISPRRALKCVLLVGTTLAGMPLATAVKAQTANSSTIDVETVIVSAKSSTTRSAVDISGVEAQKILPGVAPLKAIETMPGVVYETADPWGNNEQANPWWCMASLHNS